MPDRVSLCNNTWGRGHVCNELLRLARMPDGSTKLLCQRCNWREAGRCWQCGQPRQNHAVHGVYCNPCAKASATASMKAAEKRSREGAKRRVT